MLFKGLRAARLMVGAAAALVASSQAQALTINLIDNGGVTGSASEQGFKYAAKYWESVLSNNVTVNLGVGYSALASGVIGSTGSTKYLVTTQDVIDTLATSRTTALDQAVVLPTLSSNTYFDTTFGTQLHGVSMVRNGTVSGNSGIDLGTVQYDTQMSGNNGRLSVTEANLRALGYDFTGVAGNDANITFSSAFSFDFDPTDGITAGQMDFIGVAIHEIGHALGFTSGVDLYDQYSGVGPGVATGNLVNWNNQTAGSVLDLFRYSMDPTNAAPGTTPVLDWTVGAPAYFSIDGGYSQFNGSSLFSTGAYNGDGRQASHFKDTASALGGCDGMNQIGIMDPTFCYGEMGVIKATDLAAFDTIGWDVNFDVLSHLGYAKTTAQFVHEQQWAVPEPSSWMMMVLGFGAVGLAARRKTKVSFA